MPVIVLTDFGVLARIGADELSLSNCCGTGGYMAPEVLVRGSRKERTLEELRLHNGRATDAIVEYSKESGYDTSADIWSAGVVLLEWLTGKLHFLGTKLIG